MAEIPRRRKPLPVRQVMELLSKLDPTWLVECNDMYNLLITSNAGSRYEGFVDFLWAPSNSTPQRIRHDSSRENRLGDVLVVDGDRCPQYRVYPNPGAIPVNEQDFHRNLRRILKAPADASDEDLLALVDRFVVRDARRSSVPDSLHGYHTQALVELETAMVRLDMAHKQLRKANNAIAHKDGGFGTARKWRKRTTKGSSK